MCIKGLFLIAFGRYVNENNKILSHSFLSFSISDLFFLSLALGLFLMFPACLQHSYYFCWSFLHVTKLQWHSRWNSIQLTPKCHSCVSCPISISSGSLFNEISFFCPPFHCFSLSFNECRNMVCNSLSKYIPHLLSLLTNLRYL